MNNKREIAIDLLKQYQIDFLKSRFGENYHAVLDGINNSSSFDLYLNNYFELKNDLTAEEKTKIEIELKKEILSTNFLNTEFESFAHWKILKDIHSKFINLNPDYDLNNRLYIGTVLSDQISAGTGYESDIDALFILFDGELINVALQLAKIITQSLPLTASSPHITFPIDLDVLYKNICLNDIIRGRIIGGLYFSIYRRPTDSPNYSLNNELQEFVSSMLIESIEYFVFSHEIGHYLNGHLNERHLDEIKKLKPIDKMKRDWDEEFEADLFGLNKIIELYRSNKSMLSLLGPEIFFNFLILREKYDRRIKVEISHPPATERLNSYRIFLGNFLEDKEIQDFKKHQDIIDSLFRYYEIVLNDFVKFKSHLHK